MAIFLSALLSGCSDDSAHNPKPEEQTVKTDEAAASGKQNSKQELSILNAGNQQFSIFSYYDAFDEYVTLAKEKPGALEDAYAKTIFQPFRHNAFGDESVLEYIDLWIFDPPQDIIPLQSALEALSDKEAVFQSAIEKSLSKSAELLPGGNKTVHVFPANPSFNQAMTHARGVALNNEAMILFVHAALDAEELEQTVAHEYFHLIDMEKGTFESSTGDSTLLEATMMEGKAVAFSLLSYPNTDVSWLSNDDGKITEQVRNLFMEQKESAELQVWEDFLNGNPAKGIPPFANYIIGHEIMQSFLRNHPDMDISDWLKMTAEEILHGSDYSA